MQLIDMVFRDDECRNRIRHASANTTGKASLRFKRKVVARDHFIPRQLLRCMKRSPASLGTLGTAVQDRGAFSGLRIDHG